MLSVRDLRRPGLGPVSLEIADGAGLALTGASGSGKSLLLRAIADLDPSEGSVSACGVDRDQVPAPDWRRRVGLVPTESGWWTDRVGDHFADPAAAAPLLTALGLPDGAFGWPVSRLSSGERQRLALARALALAPPVLLLDEPTASLDAAATAAAEGLLRRRLADGVSILLVTHDPGQSRRLGFPLRVLRDGRIEVPAP